MTDTCRISRPGVGEPVFNNETGQYDGPDPVVVYQGACRIPRRMTGNSVGDARAGEASWRVGEYPLALPIDGSEAVAPGQTVTYLSSEHDPALVGQVFGITEPIRQSQATARRFVMKQTVGGGS